MPRNKQKVIDTIISNGYTGDVSALVGMKYKDLVCTRDSLTAGSKDIKTLVNKMDNDVRPADTNSGDEKVIPTDSATETEHKDKVVVVPCVIGDAGWSSYVMSLFTDDELEGSNPRLEGLRRVSRNLLGPIVSEDVAIISAPTPDNGMVAAAVASVTFWSKELQQPVRFQGAADASPNNCINEFANYLTAMADTRSKGRAFRSALCLNKVVAAEEAITSTMGDNVDINQESVKSGQLAVMRIMSDRLNVSLSKIIAHLEINKKEIRDLNHSEALSVVRYLNFLQNEAVIPDGLKKTL